MYKTDFPVIINLPQRFTATISAKVRRHVFSAVSHNIRIAGARGHVRSSAMNVTLFGDHIFPYGDLKRKIQSPVGACLKKLISDPAFAIKPTLSFFSRVGEGQTTHFCRGFSRGLGVQLQQGRYFSAWRSRE